MANKYGKERIIMKPHTSQTFSDGLRKSLLPVLAVLLLLCLPGSASAAANLLKNGNASDGMNEWTNAGGYWTTGTSEVSPYDGAFFWPGKCEAGELYQDVSLSGIPKGRVLILTAMCRDYSGNDVCRLQLSFLSGDGTVLLSDYQEYAQSSWASVGVRLTVPAGAAAARVSLIARRNSGTDNDCYFDNITLQEYTSSYGTNLLLNGSGEAGMFFWTDPDNIWSAVTSEGNYKAKDGSYFMWPAHKATESTRIYQDVSIPSRFIGKWISLSAWMANWDQAPHDQAVLTLSFYNSKGKKISSSSQSQRNPAWKKHVIKVRIPKKTVKARVTLSGKRFVGSDLDCYFDDVRLTVEKTSYKTVTLTPNRKGTYYVGDKRTLKAVYGSAKPAATAFSWYSSYNAIATVSKKGVVKFVSPGTVTIYAQHKKSGVTGSFTFKVKAR